MLFHPVKVLLMTFATSFKIHLTYHDTLIEIMIQIFFLGFSTFWVGQPAFEDFLLAYFLVLVGFWVRW